MIMEQKSKYEQALAKYNCDIDDAKVKEAVKKIISEKVPENDNTDVKRFLFGSIELTTLKTTDSEESVMAFTERVNKFYEEREDMPRIATICGPCHRGRRDGDRHGHVGRQVPLGRLRGCLR